MPNADELYCIATNQGWSDHVKTVFPLAVSVGDNYKLCTIHKSDEPKFKLMTMNLGFEWKKLPVVEVIDRMKSGEKGVFVVPPEYIYQVMDEFNDEPTD